MLTNFLFRRTTYEAMEVVGLPPPVILSRELTPLEQDQYWLLCGRSHLITNKMAMVRPALHVFVFYVAYMLRAPPDHRLAYPCPQLQLEISHYMHSNFMWLYDSTFQRFLRAIIQPVLPFEERRELFRVLTGQLVSMRAFFESFPDGLARLEKSLQNAPLLADYVVPAAAPSVPAAAPSSMPAAAPSSVPTAAPPAVSILSFPAAAPPVPEATTIAPPSHAGRFYPRFNARRDKSRKAAIRDQARKAASHDKA